MSDAADTRCCGSGMCIIDAEGRCWCGQLWNGQTMCRPSRDGLSSACGPDTDGLDPGTPALAPGLNR